VIGITVVAGCAAERHRIDQDGQKQGSDCAYPYALLIPCQARVYLRMTKISVFFFVGLPAVTRSMFSRDTSEGLMLLSLPNLSRTA
jgi:hypothetical protein